MIRRHFAVKNQKSMEKDLNFSIKFCKLAIESIVK